VKKKNTPTPEAPPAPLSRSAQKALDQAKRKAQHHRKVLLTSLAVAMVINAAIAWFLYGKLVSDVEAARVVQMTEQETRNRTAAVRNYLQQAQQKMTEEAAREELLPVLQSGDENQRTLLEQSIGKNFYKALRARLIPAGQAQLDRDSAAPIRFTELDIIRRAERRQEALPELVRIDKTWLLQLVAPLPAEPSQPVAGTLLVTLDADELFQLFSVGDNNLGETQLLQKFSGAPVQLVQKSGAAGAFESREYPIAGSHLSVKFTPSEQLRYIAREMPALWVLSVSLSTVLALVLAWLTSKFIVPPQKPVPGQAAATTLVNNEAGTTESAQTGPTVSPLHQDILDIAIIEEDEDVLGLSPRPEQKEPPASQQLADENLPPESIFRSYDIRGVVGKTLLIEHARLLGQAIGSEALDHHETAVIVARDGRLHSEALSEQLIQGITSTGCHVIDIGTVPTPLLYFATFHLPESSSGVMVTASHNPAEYNGFKIVIDGTTLADNAVMALRTRMAKQGFHQGTGSVEYRHIIPAYIERIFSDVAIAGSLSLVIDAGNAVTGVVAPALFEELGCTVTPLFCDLDGNFPNHDPDPCVEENLTALKAKVQEVNADLGVAFDGDGDRLVVVTPKGQTIWPDQLLMLFARDILGRHPGADVLFDVKCSRQLQQVISGYGGRPVMWKTGHSQMKAKMIETDALIGGEYSGHIFIKDRWYGFDDGMYAMARLLEIITLRDQNIDEVFEAFPLLPATPEIKVPVDDARKAGLIEQLIASGDFQGGKLTTLDGLRVDFGKGWGLVRASNTSPALTLRFEAESNELLEKIQQLFKRELRKIDSQLALDF